MTRALVDRLRSLSASERRRLLASSAPREVAALQWAWADFWLRPDARDPAAIVGTGQIRPPGDFMWWILQGGRGYGKSFAAMLWVLHEGHRLGHGCVFIFMSQTLEKARKDMVEGEEGILAHAPPWMGLKFSPSIAEGMITWESGAVAYLFGGDNKGKGRGPNFNRWWIDDPGAFGSNGQAVFDGLYPAFRKRTPDGTGSQGVVTTTPPPGDPPMTCPELAEFFLNPQFDPAQKDFVYSIGRSDLNFGNMNKSIRSILDRYNGTPQEEAERGGVYVKDAGTRIFSSVDFSQHRVHVLPDSLDEVVISIDPADSANDKACEVGIVVGGVRLDLARFFLLEDASGHYSADNWPARVWDVAERWAPRARRWHFLIEDNRGTTGETLLRYEERTRAHIRNPGTVATSICEVRFVTSRKSKGDRARPLPGLYRAGQIGHAAGLEQVEGQMHRLTEAERQSIRLDRADAGVYALLDLSGHLDGRAVALGGAGAAPLLVGATGGGRFSEPRPVKAAPAAITMTMGTPGMLPGAVGSSGRGW
jgi:phage terminase large subunit-like protein